MYYNELGYNAIFTENNYWIILFLLYYFDDLYDMRPMYNLDFYLNETQLNTQLDFEKLFNSDNVSHIIGSYLNHFYYFIAKDSNKFLSEYFSLDELLPPVVYLNPKQLSLIFERIWSDFNHFRFGFPDLIVYNDNEFFFVEVKSTKDESSFKQIQWHKYLSEIVNVDVIVFTVNKTNEQLNYLKNKYEKEILKFRKIAKDNKIYLRPHVAYFDDEEMETLFLTYYISHSSGNGNEKEFLEILKIPSNDERTHLYEYKDLIPLHKTNKNEIYEKILKDYSSTLFFDYRPSKKQLKRNINAEFFEGIGKYDEAIELYEKNVSEKCGSPTTYRQLIKIYKKLNNPSRILEIVEIALPIFAILEDKEMILSLIYYRNEAIREKINNKYLKIISVEENDYLYENYCVDDANQIILEKIKELESKTTGWCTSGGYWTE